MRNIKEEKGMKKFLTVFLVLCMVLCFCISVSAEPGGIYRVEEAGMTVKVPQDWIVLTRNTPPSDEDISQYYTDYAAMIEFMEAYDLYIDVYPTSDTCISLEMWSAGEMADEMRAMMEAADDATVQSILQEAQADGKFTVFSNMKFYQSNPGGGNNYRYLQYDGKAEDFTYREYAIVVDGKAMFIANVPLGKTSLDAKDISDLENFLKAVHIDGAKSIAVNKKEGAAPKEPAKAGSQNSGISIPEKGIDMETILLWVLAGIVIIAIVVIGILLLGKRRKRSRLESISSASMRPEISMQPAQPTQPPQPVSPAPFVPAAAPVQPAPSASSVQSVLPATSVQSESVIQTNTEAISQEATETVCSNCGKGNQKNAAFCMHCGTKLEKKLVCKACGAPLAERDVFCRNCGTKV